MAIGRRTTVGLIVVALTAILTAGVVAGTRPTDHGLPAARHGGGGHDHGHGSIDRKVDSLVRQMTTTKS